jgi:hypothetical protein
MRKSLAHWLLLGAVGCGVALLGAANWKLAHGRAEALPGTQGAVVAAASTTPNDQVARDLKRLDLAVRSAEARLNALGAEAQGRAQAAAAASAAAAQALREEASPTPEQLAARQREEQRAWDDALSSEQRDERWAPAYERQLQEFVTEASASRSSHVTKVSCRTSICRLDVAHDVEAEKQPFTMDLMRHLTDTAGARMMYTENATAFYVVRKGYPMPDFGPE